MKIRILHAYLGCETGCCGHVIEVDGEIDTNIDFFDAGHQMHKESVLQFAVRIIEQNYGAEHIQDLDLENSSIVDD